MNATACAVAIHLGSGDAAATLTQFSQQAHVQLLFDYNKVRGNRTQAMDACFDSAEEAFEAFLKNSKLDWSAVNARTFAISLRRCRDGTWVQVPPAKAAQTLDELGRQVSVSFQFEPSVVAGESTTAIEGCYQVEVALTDILRGTHLSWRRLNDTTFRIQLGRSPGPTLGAQHHSSVRPIAPDVNIPLTQEVVRTSSVPNDLFPTSTPIKGEPPPRVLIRGYPNEFQSTDYDYHRDWACTPEGQVERCVLRHPL